jgi:ABC-type branched-subunit amino acid transport system substrate-binding protein
VTRAHRRLAPFLALAAALSACGPGAPAGPTTAPTSPADAVAPDLRIAFVQDLSPDGAQQRVAPAFQGARLAVDAASAPGVPQVRLVPFDTGGTPEGALEVAGEISGDPSFVAAILAPQLPGQAAIGERLDAAGVSTISLSTLGPDVAEAGWAAWRRVVPDVGAEARALVHLIGDAGGAGSVCLLGDGSVASSALLRAVALALPAPPELRLGLGDGDPGDPSVASAVRDAGCVFVVWGGTAAAAGLLRVGLDSAGIRSVRLFGGESLKDASFIAEAGPRGRGTVAVCPCADLSTSTDLRARRFVQDFQSAFGVSPGPFAVEGRDVASMVLRAVRAGAQTRREVAAAVSGLRAFEGLAGTYAFGRDGDLVASGGGVRVYRDEGVRWVPVDLEGRPLGGA